MGDLVYTVMFYILSAVTVLSAAAVVTKRNLFHSALFLALSFIGVAGLYVMMNADFLAAVQVLVYGGAVAIIVVIGVMLTQRGDMSQSSPNNKWGLIGALITGVTMVVTMWSVLATPWKVVTEKAPDATAAAIAESMLTEFVVPFEVVAVLLLAAMIGAIILAKGARDDA